MARALGKLIRGEDGGEPGVAGYSEENPPERTPPMLIVDEALRGSSFGRGPRTPLPLRRRPGGTERREIRKEGVTKQIATEQSHRERTGECTAASRRRPEEERDRAAAQASEARRAESPWKERLAAGVTRGPAKRPRHGGGRGCTAAIAAVP